MKRDVGSRYIWGRKAARLSDRLNVENGGLSSCILQRDGKDRVKSRLAAAQLCMPHSPVHGRSQVPQDDLLAVDCQPVLLQGVPVPHLLHPHKHLFSAFPFLSLTPGNKGAALCFFPESLNRALCRAGATLLEHRASTVSGVPRGPSHLLFQASTPGDSYNNKGFPSKHFWLPPRTCFPSVTPQEEREKVTGAHSISGYCLHQPQRSGPCGLS